MDAALVDAAPGRAAPGRIVCLEGPSAVGKTTLAADLADALGAAVVPELDATGAPALGADPRATAAWFVARHAAQWARATALARTAPLVVLDGDPFKGLWYPWVYAADGWPDVATSRALHHAPVAGGALAFPDLYVLLGADEPTLRARRAGDPTRARRHFERHLRLVGPQRRYFAALAAAAPGRVLALDTNGRATDRAGVRVALVAAVGAAVGRLPATPIDAVALLDRMGAWVATHAPDVDGAGAEP